MPKLDVSQVWSKCEKFFIFFVLCEKGVEMIFGDVLDRNKTCLSKTKNSDYTKSLNWILLKVLVHDFGQ